MKKTTSQNEVFTYSYDKRGNRIAETGKKASQSFVYDATNRMVEGTNWKGDKSVYTYNGLGLRVNNLVTTHAGQTYDRDYVIDYTSPENDDLYVYAMGNGQLEYEQRHVYADSERIEQITEKGNGGWERTLYVHEDVMGNTRYYTKSNGQNFAELQYDAWGQPVSPNKLVNNDHGNYVFATFTGHIYDTTLDIYFAEARFYDATNRTWLAMDPIKDGLNWYQYASSNPTTYWDPTGLSSSSYFNNMNGSDSSSSQGSSIFDGLGQWFSDTADSVANWWEKNSSNVMRGVGSVLVGGVAIATAVTALPALAAFGTVGTLITAGTLLAGGASTVLGATDLLASGMSAFGNDELLKFTNTNGYLVAEGLAMTGSVLGTAATAPMAAVAQATSGAVSQSTQSQEHPRAEDLSLSGTLRGKTDRPYQQSILLADEIMNAGTPVQDPGGLPNGWRWDVPGAYRGTSGTWELVVDFDTNTIDHFLFNSKG